MFTVEQIKQAHDKVKSGADFPKYIQEIKQLGVTAFETWVKDSHTEYFGVNDYRASSTPMYEDMGIANSSDKTKFKHYLKIHQQGETDYFTFCKHCAETGIEKWFVSLKEMTCTYFDKSGNKLLVEQIPNLKNKIIAMTKDSGIPANYQTVMPYLIVKDAKKFIDFARNVFGATETYKVMRDENTIMHAEIIIGESTIMFADSTDNYKPRTAGLFVYVDNADDTYRRAIEAGATMISEPSDQPYGRSGGVTDPFGNTWWITSIK